MSARRIALVPEHGPRDPRELLRVCAALQKQANRDLLPAWGVAATVDAFAALDDVPLGYWPVLLTEDPSLGDRAGLHLDYGGQPFALLHVGSEWSVAASQACMQMLVNPLGTRTIAAPAQRTAAGSVHVLVDVCGPCSDSRYSYPIDGIAVSDFCTPAFFDGRLELGQRFSHTGAVTRALRPLDGGSLVWYEPEADRYVLRSQREAQTLDTDLGEKHGQGLSLSELLSACEHLRARHQAPLPRQLQRDAEQARWVAQERARDLRAWIEDDRLETRFSALPSLRAHASTPVELLSPAEGGDTLEYAWVEAIDVEELAGTEPARDADEFRAEPVEPAAIRDRSMPPPLRFAGAPMHGATSLAPVVREPRPLVPSKRRGAGLLLLALAVAAVVSTWVRTVDSAVRPMRASAASATGTLSVGPAAQVLPAPKAIAWCDPRDGQLEAGVTGQGVAVHAVDPSPPLLVAAAPKAPRPSGVGSKRRSVANAGSAPGHAPFVAPVPSPAPAPEPQPPVVSVTALSVPVVSTASIDALIESRR